MNEVREHVILDPFPTSQPPIEKDGKFPKIELLYDYFISTVDQIHEKISEMRAKFLKRRGKGHASNTSLQDPELFYSIDLVYSEIREYSDF